MTTKPGSTSSTGAGGCSTHTSNKTSPPGRSAGTARSTTRPRATRPTSGPRPACAPGPAPISSPRGGSRSFLRPSRRRPRRPRRSGTGCTLGVSLVHREDESLDHEQARARCAALLRDDDKVEAVRTSPWSSVHNRTPRFWSSSTREPTVAGRLAAATVGLAHGGSLRAHLRPSDPVRRPRRFGCVGAPG